MDKKEYRLDGTPISAMNLILEAGTIDKEFKEDWLQTTSVAARILRSHGHKVSRRLDNEV